MKKQRFERDEALRLITYLNETLPLPVVKDVHAYGRYSVVVFVSQENYTSDDLDSQILKAILDYDWDTDVVEYTYKVNNFARADGLRDVEFSYTVDDYMS